MMILYLKLLSESHYFEANCEKSQFTCGCEELKPQLGGSEKF
jgi:hypothetical protein